MVGGHLPQPYPKRSQWIGNRQCFVSPYAPILSASGFGVGFGYLNTFSKGIWSTRLLHVFKYIQLKIYQISAITCPYINCKFRSKFWNEIIDPKLAYHSISLWKHKTRGSLLWWMVFTKVRPLIDQLNTSCRSPHQIHMLYCIFWLAVLKSSRVGLGWNGLVGAFNNPGEDARQKSLL